MTINPNDHSPNCDVWLNPGFVCHCERGKEKLRERNCPDNVNSPAHYTAGGIECIDAIKAALTPEEFRGFLKGNVIKYAWRERLKGGVESLKKAAWYLTRLTEEA